MSQPDAVVRAGYKFRRAVETAAPELSSAQVTAIVEAARVYGTTAVGDAIRRLADAVVESYLTRSAGVSDG